MRNRSKNQITLVFIRHGATKANKEHRYLGKTDQTLSKEGEAKLEDYKNKQYYPQVDVLFTSPMKRCVQTAEILYPDLQSVQIEEWEEMDFGAFEGKNYMELQGDEAYQAWIDSKGTLPFPKGENRGAFIRRCEAGFQKMMDRVKRTEAKKDVKTIGMIVHGGTIMALLSSYVGGDYFDYQVSNGKGYVCTVEDFDSSLKMTEVRKI